MRILCLDIGDVRIGVAVSDPLGISTNGIETHLSQGAEADASYFAEMALSRGAGMILLGEAYVTCLHKHIFLAKRRRFVYTIAGGENPCRTIPEKK